MTQLDDMIRMAVDARHNAHAPYSNFAVGACIRTYDRRLFAGCNVENAAYPQGLCAEACALGMMVAHGARNIAEVVIIAEGDRLCTPCGGCRQRLAEFGGPEVRIHVGSPSELRASFTLGDLLPHQFELDPEES